MSVVVTVDVGGSGVSGDVTVAVLVMRPTALASTSKETVSSTEALTARPVLMTQSKLLHRPETTGLLRPAGVGSVMVITEASLGPTFVTAIV